MAEPPNYCAGPFGAIYDFYIEREWLTRTLGRLFWGIEVAGLYATMDAISRAAAGATILDVPCGGGVAFRGLRPDQELRYIAADLSQTMLARAERRAGRRGLSQVEFALADMRDLPFPDGVADLFLSYSGLHMLEDPESAVREIGRCLKPGGELVGCTFLTGGSRRQQRLFEMAVRRGQPVPPSAADLRTWLTDAGVAEVAIEPAGGFGVFRGTRCGA